MKRSKLSQLKIHTIKLAEGRDFVCVCVHMCMCVPVLVCSCILLAKGEGREDILAGPQKFKGQFEG